MKKNFFYNFLLTGSNLLFPLLTFPYLSRVLGADGLGVCNFILSYGQNFIIIAALGIPVYGIREIAKIGDDKENRSKLFTELLTIHFLFSCLLLLIYVGSVFLYSDLRDYKDLALLGGSMILMNVFSVEWLFSGINDFKYITIRSLIIRALSVVSILCLVKGKDDFFIYILITVLTVLATAILDISHAKKFIYLKIGLTVKGVLAHVKPVTFLGVYMVLVSIYSVLPVTLLGFLSTKSAVGYYFGANKIIRMVISGFTALIAVMIPRLNMFIENQEYGEYLTLINKSLKIVIIFGIPITFFVFLLAHSVIMILSGKDFVNSVFVMQIMAPVILLVAFAQVFVLLILSANRKDKQMVMLSVVGVIISVTINLIFIPIYAEQATGFSQLLSELVVTVISFFIARKVINFYFPTKFLMLNLLCVIPFAGFSYFFSTVFKNDFLILASSGVACGVYFLLYQWLIIKDEFFLQTAEPIVLKVKQKFF